MTKDKQDLLPCPFCGGDGGVIDRNPMTYFEVGCHNEECPFEPIHWACGIGCEEKAIKAWNTRTPAPSITIPRVLLNKFISECEGQMSYSEHRKKVAAMDYHTSEEQHQDGRWHCANDLREWAEKLLEEF